MSVEVLVVGQPNMQDPREVVFWEFFSPPIGWGDHARNDRDAVGRKGGAAEGCPLWCAWKRPPVGRTTAVANPAKTSF